MSEKVGGYLASMDMDADIVRHTTGTKAYKKKRKEKTRAELCQAQEHLGLARLARFS